MPRLFQLRRLKNPLARKEENVILLVEKQKWFDSKRTNQMVFLAEEWLQLAIIVQIVMLVEEQHSLGCGVTLQPLMQLEIGRAHV